MHLPPRIHLIPRAFRPRVIFGLTTAAMLMPGSGLAQEASYGLDEVLSIAARHTPDRRIIQHEFKAKKAEIRKFRASALPQVSTDLSASRMSTPLDSQTSYGGGVGGQTDPGGGAPRRWSLHQDRGAPGGGGTGGDIPDRAFGNAYQWNLTLQAPIYTFGRLTSVYEISNLQKELAQQSRETKDQQYYMDVIKAYNDALLGLNIHKAAKRSERHAEAMMEFTKVEYDGGGRSKIDYLRSKSFHSNALAQEHKTHSQARSAKARLKIILGLPKDTPFALEAGADLPSAFLSGSREKREEPGKPDSLKLQQLQTNVAQEMLGYRRAEIWPSISLFGSLNSDVQRLKAGAFETDAEKHPRDVFSANQWTYSAGLKLTWTLFDGFRTTSQARQAAEEAAIARIQLKKQKREEDVRLAEARSSYKAARLVHDSAQAALEASELAFDQVRSDYQAGTADLTQMLEVQKELWEAEKNLSQAYAEKILAAANLRLARGQDLYDGSEEEGDRL